MIHKLCYLQLSKLCAVASVEYLFEVSLKVVYMSSLS
jgi:hypothetical protein